MSIKTFFLIVLLTIFTGGLVFLALLPERAATPVKKMGITPTPTVSPKQTSLWMQFGESNATKSATLIRKLPIDVLIDTSSQAITGAQIELSYDPTVLMNVKITQGSFFDVATTGATLSLVDPKLGRVSYVLTQPQNRTVQGVGIAAVLTYDITPLALTSSQSATTISFTSKTSVSSPSTSSSVLKEAKPFTFDFKNSVK